ncbi:DUF2325 domain-containing protein [Alicyclobacillus cycloheptanicus]|uniref:Amidohydrolase n=1 Tax=Alicyclobacillus cycloheptanicus TaxID=1457 RepID=A0ABT9XLC0_9BACL|nr:hypothetical protein [Alicyclobacillus cycloheptanicus]MDQ0190819.1 putative amidohydrolase [Alicyclobacillus cycloheptanicus]WDM02702.1 DUF2325 domain-containing protein [Alicyclobacillus cycloheptanicus]
MFQFWMRLRIENGECIPQMSFLADPCGFESRDALFEHVQKNELLLSVEELQACLAGNVFEADERLVVVFSFEEVRQLLCDSATVFLWANIPAAVRQTFATRNILPITRKMPPMQQALVLVRHLKASAHKRAEWLQLVERYLTLTKIDDRGSTLKSFIMTGTLEELETYAKGDQVKYVEHALVPKVVATGYLMASFAAYLDPERCHFWLELIHHHFDQDFRYLEQILHTMPIQTFFQGKKNKPQDRTDLVQYVQDLEVKIEQLQQAHHQEIAELIGIIESLHQRQATDVRTTAAHPTNHPRLRGRKIAVIGDEIRHPVYRALLEREGAEAILVPGFSKLHMGANQLQHADGVIFVTAYSSHALYYALKARRSLSSAVMVNRGGMLAFQNAIHELSERLR